MMGLVEKVRTMLSNNCRVIILPTHDTGGEGEAPSLPGSFANFVLGGKYLTIHPVVLSHCLKYKFATIQIFPNDANQHNSF